MKTLRQQVLFLLVAFVSILAFFLYQENIQHFLNLPEAYRKLRLFKYGFSVLLNYALISLIYVVLRRTFATILVSQVLIFILTLINIKKEQYLSASLIPSDFLLAKETLIAAPMLLKLAFFAGLIICIALMWGLYKKERAENNTLLWLNAMLSFSILGFFVTANFQNNFSEICSDENKPSLCKYNIYLPNTHSDWVGDHMNIRQLGFSAFFFSKTVDGIKAKVSNTAHIPEAKIQSLLTPPIVANTKNQNNVDSDKVLPNIIFVMSESHWDATKLDPSIPTNITPTIAKNQVSQLLSPSFGGGTANVEFEVLTSLNTHLNQNQLAYVAKLKRPTYSLAMYLNSLGYNTTAMHNNGKYFYNRSSVYQNLGFQQFTSIENMVSAAQRAKYINQAGWANDELIYNSIQQQLKQQDQPQFIYAISVENHPMYNDDRFGANNFKITKSGISDRSKRALNTYLSGMQRADQHLKALLDSAQQLERPTIVIFFGDHLPNLQNVYDEYGFWGTEQAKTEKNDVRFYQTPLAIWSNFPLNKKQWAEPFISAHFLAPQVLKAAHVPLSPYYQFIQKVNACYAAIHKTGNHMTKTCEGNAAQLLKEYKTLNLDILDGKNFSYQVMRPSLEANQAAL
ncbi:sulfatase-like hydrolase/transferase [Acinetobacter defluvii]|uniref:Sulfatase-like hydrolase/transferase n=1 Tax=Acinetobacter defluvii TaxID=1871111 RepID=A0A2S2FHG7_9GAMM|nr:alkaline phosphatase family protein [Acinetobacter defluvii]AWL30350.1 sulfatase-like hydrolase/transferase [Acinetobacter defluvii]